MSTTHTPGPWRWEFNAEHRRLHLVGGRRRHDLTVMDFERWGMNGATMRLRDTAHDGMQLLYRVHERAAELGLSAVVRQSDSEAQLIGWVHAAADAGDPVILNAGGLTHTSIALRDACAELRAPLIEVHISNVHAREEFRHHSYVSPIASGVIAGLGIDGYRFAIERLAVLV